MIKKLTLITFVVFLALGSLLPHTIHASSPVGGSSAGVNFVNIVSPETNLALHNCATSDFGGSLGVGVGGISKVLSFGSDKDFTGNLFGMCDATGKTNPFALSQEEVTAYFQDNGNTQGGINSILSNINAQLLNQRPSSGIDYINEKVYAITNPGKVYAADNPSTYYPGPGSELLRPIQGFWGWSVNLVFGFLVLLILVVAFAIMFRQRLGGAAEVTIQNAIPSIALAMILIPLSYAISGLFIDAITLGTNAVHGFLLGPQSPGASVYANRPNATAVECDLQNTDVVGGVKCDRGYYADDPSIDVFRARDRIDLRQTGAQIGQGISNSIPSAQGIFNLIGGIIKLLPGDEDQFSEFAWFGNVINIIIGVLTIWIALKIFFKLINKYLTLLIMPAFSPFIFATAALPGNGTKSIVSYLKTMGSAALFYIVTYAMFILTLIFTDPSFQNSLPDFRTGGYIPPLLGLQSIIKSLTTTANAFPLTQLLMTLVGLGIYFSIPKTLDGIDEALGTKFVLPQLLKTPFESMQESFKVATRAFPSAVARTASIAGRTGKGIGTAPGRAYTGVRNVADRIYGKTPGDSDTYLGRRRSALAEEKETYRQGYEKARRDGNVGMMNYYQGRMAAVDARGGVEGTGVGTPGEEKEKAKAFTAVFSYANGSPPNFISLTGNEVKTIMQESGALVDDVTGVVTGTSTPVDRYPGELVFEAKNFEFSTSDIIEYGSVKRSPAGFETNEWDSKIGDVVAGVEVFDKFLTPAKAPIPDIRLSVDKIAIASKTKIKVGFKLTIIDAKSLFGGKLDPNTGVPQANAGIPKAKVFQDVLLTSGERSFRIGGVYLPDSLKIRFNVKAT